MKEELKDKNLSEPMVTYKSSQGLPKSYVNPFEDWAFKKIFASEVSLDLTKAFLNAVLAGKRKIKTIAFGKNEYPGEIRTEAGVVFDFICTDIDGTKFLVEVQRQKQEYFKERSLFYASRLINDEGLKGDKEWKYNLKEVYSISLLEKFSLPDTDPEKYLHQVSLCDIETGVIFYDKLHFVYIEVEKFRKKKTELKSDLDEWLYALRNVSEMTEEPQFFKTPELKQFIYLANYANLTDEERRIHRAAQKIKWDNQNVMDYAIETAVRAAVETACQINRKEIARALLADGIPLAQVIKSIGLSEIEIFTEE